MHIIYPFYNKVISADYISMNILNQIYYGLHRINTTAHDISDQVNIIGCYLWKK